jgi:hypothetical protein
MTYLKDWSARDRGLAEGLLALEDSTGPHGIPWADAMNDDNDGWFEVEEHVDYAQAAVDRWKAEHDSGDVEPGTRLFVVDTRSSSADESSDDEPDSEDPDQ